VVNDRDEQDDVELALAIEQCASVAVVEHPYFGNAAELLFEEIETRPRHFRHGWGATCAEDSLRKSSVTGAHLQDGTRLLSR
jgi:hypothetical protein